MTMYEKLEAYLGFPPDIIRKVILVESKGVETIEKWYYTEKPKPTQEELDAVELSYVQKRLKEYPSIQDQLDMLWHSIDQNPELKQKYFDFYEAIKAVKVKYPKNG
jgi:hypothetical protein